MKGIINTDNLLHAILDKEKGLLPKGKILTHLAVMQIPTYDKLLFFSDAAVIPRPTLQQRIEMVWYAICTCRRFGIEQPRISLIHCTEKVSAKFPIRLIMLISWSWPKPESLAMLLLMARWMSVLPASRPAGILKELYRLSTGRQMY